MTRASDASGCRAQLIRSVHESLTCFGLNLGMPIFKVIILAIVQGLAELLPVSSSAHVVVAEKLMGLDPSSPR